MKIRTKVKAGTVEMDRDLMELARLGDSLPDPPRPEAGGSIRA